MKRDDGAMAILTAFVAVILVAMAAFAVDMGSMQLQNRELQTSADAGALAIAHECYTTGCPGAESADFTASGFADSNSTTGGGFFTGTTASAALATNSVTVTASGTNKALFRKALGIGDAQMLRSATVAWGSPTKYASGLPLTINVCEFEKAAPDASSLADPSALAKAVAGTGTWPAGEVRLMFAGASTCGALTAGKDAPGAFGWLDPDAGSCTSTTDVVDVFLASPGESIPNLCPKTTFESFENRIVTVPVFELVTKDSKGVHYGMAGYAAFLLTGWGLPSMDNKAATLPDGKKPGRPCDASQTCITGYFTSIELSDAPSIGSTPVVHGVTIPPKLVD